MARVRGGGRVRGRGTGRGRAVPHPVADGPPERQAAFEARKAGLMEKALELAEMEDAAVAVVCSGIDGLGGADAWPSAEGARAVAELFHELPEEIRSTGGHASHVEGLRDAQSSRLAEVREGGIAAALGPSERALDGLSMEALRELLASVEASHKAARSRIRQLQPQSDESVAENSVSVADEEAGTGTSASGEVQGKLRQLPEDLAQKPEPANGNAAPYDTGVIERINVAGEEDASVQVRGRQKQPQDADEVQRTQKQPPGDDVEEDAAWMKQLVEDLTEKPEPANGNAAPYDAGMIERIDVAGEEDASVLQVRRRQKQPQDADEVERTQKQPPGDDIEDAGWMKQLVEDLEEKPEPTRGSAAPYDVAGMIEYINVGGYVMERDAYDFIRFDLGMFPPSLEPESPDCDEQLRLWSWDNSYPHGAPPPPPPK
ncbi:hypothetical protein QYE76_057207 [Lolium multiflorum]|uniref:MADS-box domain-containing protein n=1 Tax=Lolium multiflorum TaxID=4521 RepID=A0AAD8T4T6_LOLMU|nr:hypothetical protein QYE76_057207 [Lolium multiflorum]